MVKKILKLVIGVITFIQFGCSKDSSTTLSVAAPITIAKQLNFSGTNFTNNGTFPKLYTCDSSGIAPGLQWTNAPTGTTNYVVTMHHFPPTYPIESKHVYLVLYNITSSVSALPQNNKTIGLFGINTVDGKNSYTPPCSQGPGAKTYILTMYALNTAPTISVPTNQVTMDIVLAGMRNKILDSTIMTVTYTR